MTPEAPNPYKTSAIVSPSQNTIKPDENAPPYVSKPLSGFGHPPPKNLQKHEENEHLDPPIDLNPLPFSSPLLPSTLLWDQLPMRKTFVFPRQIDLHPSI